MYVEAAMMGLSAMQEIGATNRARREGRRQVTFLSNALKDLGLDGQIKKEGNNTIISVEKSNSEGPKDITPVSSESGKEQEKV